MKKVRIFSIICGALASVVWFWSAIRYDSVANIVISLLFAGGAVKAFMDRDKEE